MSETHATHHAAQQQTALSQALADVVQRHPDAVSALAELQRRVKLIEDNVLAGNEVWDDKSKRLRARLCFSRLSGMVATGICAQVWLDLQAAIDSCPVPSGAALN